VAVGVCAALNRDDQIISTHRGHGHCIAKGADLKRMMAELYGKRTGYCKGKGGSMHIADFSIGMLGANGIVAGGIPIVTGAGLAAQLEGKGRVAVSFFGDGAASAGPFHESINIATLWKLPVIYVCENNFYSSHLSLLERRVRDNIPQIGYAHGLPGVRVDGNDVLQVQQAAAEAVRRARSGEGPTLLEYRTYRWRGHVGPSWDTDVGVKRKDELGEWLRSDPIARLRDRLAEGGAPLEMFERISREVTAEVEAALAFARESPYPSEAELLTHVFSPDGETTW
jgi:pyruvate dehydrogenase E1 component alpha subunit